MCCTLPARRECSRWVSLLPSMSFLSGFWVKRCLWGKEREKRKRVGDRWVACDYEEEIQMKD